MDLSRRGGIQTGMFLMWGYEGEELSDIEATVEHVKRCRPDIFFTTVSYPIKGTPYFKNVSQRLVSIEPWAQSSDRNFAVSGRHSRAFYKHADALLRTEMAPEPEAAAIQAARQPWSRPGSWWRHELDLALLFRPAGGPL